MTILQCLTLDGVVAFVVGQVLPRGAAKSLGQALATVRLWGQEVAHQIIEQRRVVNHHLVGGVGHDDQLRVREVLCKKLRVLEGVDVIGLAPDKQDRRVDLIKLVATGAVGRARPLDPQVRIFVNRPGPPSGSETGRA